jgi:hypothetical protein
VLFGHRVELACRLLARLGPPVAVRMAVLVAVVSIVAVAVVIWGLVVRHG